ncbi:GNAT family N-acetyltransferase [Massilia putida]|uniref:GNAT family N-acetyltransferase n=1 Tax=Massilia putida TaxID=1141883 RepID=UPI0009513E31|nr:GNAT family N-acetyltransferase [Massilia putida]
MASERFTIRPARPDDAEPLIGMMRALAAFEGYLPRFRVMAGDLRVRAFGPGAQCGILVAQGQDGRLAGYAVWLAQAFTYDLRPTVILKELFVDVTYRNQGIAAGLLESLRREAERIDAGWITWLVLPSNEAAKRLYRRVGGAPDADWEHWRLALPQAR